MTDPTPQHPEPSTCRYAPFSPPGTCEEPVVDDLCQAHAPWAVAHARLDDARGQMARLRARIAEMEERERRSAPVLDAAIVLAQDLAETMEPTSDLERKLIAAVNAMLDSRHTLRDQPAEAAPIDDEALIEALAQAMRDANTAEAWMAAHPHVPVAAYARAAIDVFRATIAAGQESGALSSPGAERAESVPQPTSDSPEGVWVTLGNIPIQFWACPVEGHSDRRDQDGGIVVTVEWDGGVARCTAEGCGRTSADVPVTPALTRLRTRDDDYRAISEAIGAVAAHGPELDGAGWRRELERYLELTTALNEAARDAHKAAELDDEGFQELRLGVLPIAAQIADGAVSGDEQPLHVRDQEQTVIGTAERLAEWVATGSYDWTQGTREQRAYADGYSEAVRRLRDNAAYRAWWESLDNAEPDARTFWMPEVRADLAGYLEHVAPDPDDPWADTEPLKRLGAQLDAETAETGDVR